MRFNYGFSCPDCGAPLRVRNSEGLAATFRVLLLQCTNEACGATFRGDATIAHRLSFGGGEQHANIPLATSLQRTEAARAVQRLMRAAQGSDCLTEEMFG